MNVGMRLISPAMAVNLRVPGDGKDMQLGVSDAGLGDHCVGKRLHPVDRALQYHGLQAVVVIEMHVQRGDG